MEAFVKRFSDWRTSRQSTVLQGDLVLDSLEAEASSVTLRGLAVERGNAGDWLILSGQVYSIAAVTPAAEQTSLSLQSPLDVFSRPIKPPAGTWYSIGAFIQACLEEHWIRQSDPVYALPYLTVTNLDTVPYAAPELDSSGCFNLAAYARLMRQSYRTAITFAPTADGLSCTIRTAPAAARQISFSDGRSQLDRVDYAAAGMAKLTVYQTSGDTVTESTWYLAEDGTVSQEIPARRAPGRWDQLTVSADDDVQARVTETFAASMTDHRLEFHSSIDLAVGDRVTFNIYGTMLTSEIALKRLSSKDRRIHYKAGLLRTTAAEKLKGVLK